MIARDLLRLFACFRTWAVLSLMAGLLLSAPAAFAEKRVALVIGNSAYAHAPQLPNPANDADAMSALLKDGGFDVVETHHDLGVEDMRRVVRDFTDQMPGADVAVVYFAGHGVEVDGGNYLVPVDAQLRRDIDVEDETVSLDRVLKVIEPAKRLRLVILDACRENPFAQSMKRTTARRAIGRGLAPVEPSASDTLIAFAAKAGSTAEDGQGAHSPFAMALLKNLATPGLDLRIAFGRVRDDVLAATGNQQEPFVYGSLGGATVALVPAPSDTGGATAPASPADQASAQAWRDYDEAAKVGTKGAWDAFLAAHPSGFYADLARSQLTRTAAVAPTGAPESKVQSTGPIPKMMDKKPKSVSPLACCLAYYAGELSLEGWAPRQRCQVNRQQIPGFWNSVCTYLRENYPSRYSALTR
jgi:uncharacterized caspase-like protein